MRFASVAMLLLAWSASVDDAGAQLRAGTAAPDVDLKTLSGAPFRLSALKGRPVVMTFWGTWCPPCRQEFPELVEIYRKLHGDGLEVVGVNQFDQEVGMDDVQRFVKEFAPPFPIVIDTRGRFRRAYRLVGLPTTVFVDTTGVIVYVVSGPVSAQAMEAGLGAIGVKPE